MEVEKKAFGLFDPFDPEIFRLIPPGVNRVKIQDINGQEKWRSPSSFEDGDRLILENGEPRCMLTKPGRKSKREEVEEFVPEATTENAAEKMELKRRALENDSLLNLTKENPDDDSLLNHLLEGLAEEAASLSFERAQNEARNRETSQISLRRVNTLRAMAEIYLKKKENQSAGVIDLKSPQFFVLFTYILETFKEAMTDCSLDEDAVQVVMERLMSAIREDSWSALAIRKMKGE